MTRRLAAGIFLLVFACGSAAQGPVAVKIAAINDFHGNLLPPADRVATGDGRIAAGGMAQLATIVNRLRAASANFAFVSAGDLVGASPLLSDWFEDEPVIEGMNLMGLDFNGVGNHEFDRGMAHLRRLQEGGCPPAGCKAGLPFAGARFRMLAANVLERSSGKPVFPAYAVREFDGVKVAFIGLTLRGTPFVTTARAVAGLEFRDEAETVNGLLPELKSQGVAAIVVLLHQGGSTSGGPNECADFRGPVVGIAARLDKAVSVVVSAHTHQAYVCRLDGRLVTSAGSSGRFVTEIDIGIDPARGEIVSARAINHPVTPDTPEQAEQAVLVARYAKLAAPLERVVGRLAAPVSRRTNGDGESAMGQLIADAHLAATAGAGAVVAFMNPGGIRSSLEMRGDGSVTYADLFAVYPFANTLVTMTLTGAQIVGMLERYLQAGDVGALQVSRGFSYAWNPALPAGRRVVQDSPTLHGKALEPAAAYRVTVNSFMAQGGDGLAMLREGRERAPGPGALDALVRYVQQGSPLAAGQERRVRNVAESNVKRVNR